MTLLPVLLSRMMLRRIGNRKTLSRALVAALTLALAVPPGFAQSPPANSQTAPAAKDAKDKDAEQNAAPQNKDSVATIAVDVKVVTLPVTVRDKHGKIVNDLTKDDFTLQEDGRPQTIKYFSQDVESARSRMGLLVDTSRSQTNVLEAERNASRSFLDQMLAQPKDKAFLHSLRS